MATLQKFHQLGKYLGDGSIDLDSHTFKAVLSNTLPDVGIHTVLSHIAQIANGNGYTTGGVVLTGVTYVEVGGNTGIWQWSAADFSWTAAGGSIGPFRYIVIYDDTQTVPAKPLVGYLDYGAALTIVATSTFTVDVGVDGILQVN